MEKINKVAEEFLAKINAQSSITIFECAGESDDKIMFVKTAIEGPHLIFEIEVESSDAGAITGKIIDVFLVDVEDEATEVHLPKWHLNSEVVISFAALKCEGGTMIR